ncbi:MAG: cellulase family glycosylhydrolase [Deltaproteobacteria bacterium]|nr:cellulase family glycosylhydrolase [Deltaproteobacteria bacterium]
MNIKRKACHLTLALAFVLCPVLGGCGGRGDGVGKESDSDVSRADAGADAGAAADAGSDDAGTDGPTATDGGSDGGAETEPDSGAGPDASIEKPWIKVAPNGRYFMFEDGTPFFPLGTAASGEQLSLDYFGAVAIGGKTVTYDPETLEKRFQDTQANGENFFRIDIEGTGWWQDEDIKALVDAGKIQFLEDPAGTFNEEYATRIDHFIGLAEKYDIYVDLVLIAHTCQLVGLDDNLPFWPYHVSHGGPLNSLGDLVTRADAKALWKKRLQYIVDRWGSSSNIFTWELWNELTGCGGSGSDQIDADWVEEMGKFIRDYEISRYGKAHLVSVSATGYVPATPKAFWVNAGTDIAMHHYYHGVTTLIPRPVDVVLELRKTLKWMHEEIVGYRRPVMENERYVGGKWPESLTAEAEHNVAWTHLASGSSGAGATWAEFPRFTPDTGDRGRGAFVADTHRVMREMLKTVDLTSFDSRNYNDQVTSRTAGIVPTAASDGKRMIGWLLHDNPSDYRVDIVNSVRGASSGERLANQVVVIQGINYWYSFLVQEGIQVDTDPYLAETAALFVKYFGVDQAAAEDLALQMFQDPSGFFGRYRDLLKNLPQQDKVNMAAGLSTLLDRIITDLEALESQHHALEKAYKGHPEVSTTLDFDALCEGGHVVKWIDDVTGNEIETISASGPQVTMATPPFRRHVAFMMTSECP